MGTLGRAQLAALVDHTLLRPEATTAEVAAHCAEAGRLGVFAVCLAPARLPLGAGILPAGVRLAVVAGFPSGAHLSPVKAEEAAGAVRSGAHEVDMVVDLGAVKAADWAAVRADVAAVRASVPPPTVLKVILETAVLDDDEVVAGCRIAAEAGADFVKTSTGFHPAGGATVAAVRRMAATVGGRLGIKASGGIRTAEQALAMVAAGATRIGASGTAAILAGLAGADRDSRPAVSPARPPARRTPA